MFTTKSQVRLGAAKKRAVNDGLECLPLASPCLSVLMAGIRIIRLTYLNLGSVFAASQAQSFVMTE